MNFVFCQSLVMYVQVCPHVDRGPSPLVRVPHANYTRAGRYIYKTSGHAHRYHCNLYIRLKENPKIVMQTEVGVVVD